MPLPPVLRLFLSAALLAALAGCAAFPELDASAPALPVAPPPALLPLDQLLAQAAVPPRATEATAAELAARAARLRAEAAAMR